MLRDQYMAEFSWLHTLRAQSDYWLEGYQLALKAYLKKFKVKLGPKGCQYNLDKKLVRRPFAPIVMNFMGYQAHKLFREVMIIDEAHAMLPVLQNIHAKRIWKHTHNYPDSARNVEDLLFWLEGLPHLSLTLAKLKNELSSIAPATTVEFGTDWYKGTEKDCIRLLPMDVSGEAPIFWPSRTKKLVLMSATIDESDVNNMGLGTRKVCYIDAKSEIPEERRPITYNPVGSMSKRNRSKTLPLLISRIGEILEDNKDKKGFIHATYEVADLLKTQLDNDRFIFHNKSNKKAQFAKFLAMPKDSGAVFVGSGMAEGIDLKYDAGHFQIITKIPFKSLANPCNRFLAANKPREYIWLTSKDILQASGRICRTPDDYGSTVILDSDLDLWFERATAYGQIPEWFRLLRN
jgi:Rad3-related DNA helicase